MRLLAPLIVWTVCQFQHLAAQTLQGQLFTRDGEPAAGAVVTVEELRKRTLTRSDGTYRFESIPAGTYTLRIGGIGYQQLVRRISIASGETLFLQDTIGIEARTMSEVVVYGASRRLEKITDAPAAISVVMPNDLARATTHGQLPKTLEHFQGVDVVQSGMNDFNVNTRGFNTSINRRVLVLIDGRDPSTPLLNLLEWNSLQQQMSDVRSIEVIRGPGSALYGANAYNGVINITTYAPREVLGTTASITGGEFATFRASVRHAAALDRLSYKISAGVSFQNQVWIQSRDTTAGGRLEYPGLARDVTGQIVWGRRITNIDSLINAHRRAYLYAFTVRADYDFSDVQRLVLDLGYSRYGNEYFVNQTGRILIPNVEKPYVRLAYNSERFNIQGYWTRRVTPEPQIVMNAAATSAEKSDVAMLDAQWNDHFFDERLRVIAGIQHSYEHVRTAVAGALAIIDPSELHNNFTGLYGQAEYSLLPTLRLVGALRLDRSTFFETQLSPKGGIVWSPTAEHTFRATVNRSFLRPSYPDKYRRSPAGPPVAFARIDSIISAQTGVQRLGIQSLPQWNLGNPTIGVESAVSYEVGYKGVIGRSLYLTLDAYINQRRNFISVPLGGLAPQVYRPVRYGDRRADSLLRVELNRINPAYFDRLAYDRDGTAALIITPTNIAEVVERGVELGINYYISDYLMLSGNAAWLDYRVIENSVSAQKIVPNTSPRRYNLGVSYTIPRQFDVSINLRYVDKFTWVAGLFEGVVPSYAVVNLNASYYLTDDLRVSVNVFNLLDRPHYEIFGGTILRRYATAGLSYELH
ncbi:MAG: TonB-dependent receptor [Candidatus Kapabacteria bacterium]|nr:TonB-dependent receptor [Candidatus Kapabacteria bacterium]